MAVSTNAMVSRTRDGTLISPTPGSSMTMVPMRANVSMNAAASAGRNETSMRMRLTADDAGGDPQHLGVQFLGHERQRDQQRYENRQDLRHEGQRHFLDLGERLQQRDRDTDRQPHQHDRRRNDDERVDRFAGDVENFRSCLLYTS